MASITRHDINGAAVMFDGLRTLHKNDAWTGDRYVIVLYSPDFSFHNSNGFTHIDERTETIRRAVPVPSTVEQVAVSKSPDVAARRNELERVLSETTYCERRDNKPCTHSKYAGASHTLVFGNIRSRKGYQNSVANAGPLVVQPMSAAKRMPSKANDSHREVKERVERYLATLLPDTDLARYESIFIGKNSDCNWHYDVYNVGQTIITAVGDYAGGDFLVDPSQSRQMSCASCKRCNHCAHFCRVHRRHTADEWWRVPEFAYRHVGGKDAVLRTADENNRRLQSLFSRSNPNRSLDASTVGQNVRGGTHRLRRRGFTKSRTARRPKK